jgi:hypothetical protein
MIARFTNGGGGGVISAASGENDGPGLLTIGGVALGAYVVYKTFM